MKLIELQLRALGVSAGDEAITANAGFYSERHDSRHRRCAGVCRYSGKLNLLMDVACAEKAITPKRKPSSSRLFGQLAEMSPLCTLAKNTALRWWIARSRMVTANTANVREVLAILQRLFFPTKTHGALGDGGAVVTSDAALATRVPAAYGWTTKYTVADGARNSRLDEMQAAGCQ